MLIRRRQARSDKSLSSSRRDGARHPCSLWGNPQTTWVPAPSQRDQGNPRERERERERETEGERERESEGGRESGREVVRESEREVSD